MPGTPQPVVDPRWGPHWTTIINAIRRTQQQTAAIASGQPAHNVLDQWGNTLYIVGQLAQVVTIGAGWDQTGTGGASAGVQVGTALPLSGHPNTGIAKQSGLVTTTISTTAGSASATVASAANMTVGMVIGAADVNDPANGVATPALKPSPPTTITGISGTTITLSQPAAETGTGLFCAACNWTLV